MVFRKSFCVIFVVSVAMLAAGSLQAVQYERSPQNPDIKVPVTPNPGPGTRDTGGPDAYGYAWIDSAEPGGPTFGWVDITGTGTPILLGDDEVAGPFALGFTFDLYGTTSTDVYVSSNGWLSVTAAGSSDFSNDCPIPDTDGPSNLIAPMWDDLDPFDTADVVYFETFAAGSCPYGGYAGACAVVLYDDLCFFPGGAMCTRSGVFEAILFDDNDIIYQFEDAGTAMGGSSTTGIQNADGTIGLTYGCDGAYLSDSLAVRFFQPPAGDLTITKAADSGFGIGGPFNFTITVTNNGPEDQTNVVVEDTLPANLTYVGDNCGGGIAGQDWTWNVGGMSNGAIEVCELAVQFVGDCEPSFNTATVSGDVFDPPGNNSSTATNAYEAVGDPSFESGSPNAEWAEFSATFGTPLCTIATCGFGGGTGPLTGDWWTWFGGIAAVETGSMTQTVTIPAAATELGFWLETPVCDSAADFMQVTMDGDVLFTVDGGAASCGVIGYAYQTVDISAYADDGDHVLEFYSEVFGQNFGVSNFFVDDVSISGSDCTTVQPPHDRAIPTLSAVGIALLAGLLVGVGFVLLRRMS
jgi:uncharacterized repeat protein (TIGR01451 family)